jgi:hypothetical protein
MSLAPVQTVSPLVAAVRFSALGGNRRHSVALDFVDASGATLATSLTDPEALDAFGRQAMAVAVAARACDPNVIPIGQRPHASVMLPPVASTPETDDGRGEAEDRAFLYMLVACAALALAIALVAWDLLK